MQKNYGNYRISVTQVTECFYFHPFVADFGLCSNPKLFNLGIKWGRRLNFRNYSKPVQHLTNLDCSL